MRAVVRGAVDRSAGAKRAHRDAAQLLARREEQRVVVDPGRAAGGLRSAAPGRSIAPVAGLRSAILVQHDERLPAGTERCDRGRALQRLEADHLVVEAHRSRDVRDVQLDRPKTCPVAQKCPAARGVGYRE